MKWISVKDKLPEDRTLVFASCGGDEYVVSFYRDGDFYFNDVYLWNCKVHNVTHWIIPESPMEDTMGWAGGSYLAQDMYDKIREHIPEDKRETVAKIIYDDFCDEDADDWDVDSQLLKDANSLG